MTGMSKDWHIFTVHAPRIKSTPNSLAEGTDLLLHSPGDRDVEAWLDDRLILEDLRMNIIRSPRGPGNGSRSTRCVSVSSSFSYDASSGASYGYHDITRPLGELIRQETSPSCQSLGRGLGGELAHGGVSL